MKDEKYICPCCGADLGEFVHESVVKYIRRRNAEKALAARMKTPEMRQEMYRRGAAQLKKWREENPEKARALAARAKAGRTPKAFAKQGASVRETNLRKSMKFAELLMAEKAAGREITPEMERELLRRAAELAKAELKAERKAAKRADR